MTDSQSNNIDGVAIIGMAGRFPGAANVNDLWINLCEGAESITFFSNEELDQSINSILRNHENYVRARGILNNEDKFDAEFFGVSRREAEMMDPQQRIFLEVAWEALENAGYSSDIYGGLIGVFAGAGWNSYFSNIISTRPELIESFGKHRMTFANGADYLASRVSYKLNLRGPSVSMYTGCSTSLVAVCYGFDSLMSYQCDIVLAGGVFVECPINSGYLYEEGEIFSKDGHCRPFDAQATGTVFGNAAGIVVLKRLADARRDGDFIYAIIRGVAVNNDGSKKMSFYAPSVDGQAEVIEMAQANAEISPRSISYVETHCTATSVGDPIEIAALTQAFKAGNSEKASCAIGSIKGNLGHLDAAAGIAGLIKTALMLQNKTLLPSINFNELNQRIDFSNSPFYVNTKLLKWETAQLPRRAGVSSFGVGGTNSHIVLEEEVVEKTNSASRPWQVLILSGKKSSAMEKMTANFINHLKTHPDLNLADVAYTLQFGRKTFTHRRMVVAKDIDDVVSRLESNDKNRVFSSVQEHIGRDVVFMFSGQGSQYVNMGIELYKTEAEFKKHFDYCSEILIPYLSFDLREIIFAHNNTIEEAEQKLQQTLITQPSLFAVEYALSKLLISWGVRPAAFVGHSIGEYVAACLSGVFSLEDALSLVAARSRLMQELATGTMMTVSLSEEDIQSYVNSQVSLAAVNAPLRCVVSGARDAIEDFKNKVSISSIDCKILRTSHAFHSKMMDPILDTFTEHVRKVKLNIPRIPIVSNLTGTWMTNAEALDASYWANHLRKTVRFSNCIQTLLKENDTIFLEVGPGRTLNSFVRMHLDNSSKREIFSTMRHPTDKKSDLEFILTTLGMLWIYGVQVDWTNFYSKEVRRRVPLPTYAFDHQRYWIEPNYQHTDHISPLGHAGNKENGFDTINSHKPESVFSKSDESSASGDYVAPRNELEIVVAGIWQEVLGSDKLDIYSNFLEFGGDSLLAGRVIVRINELLEIDFPIDRFFESPTISDISIAIEELLVQEIEKYPEDVL